MNYFLRFNSSNHLKKNSSNFFKAKGVIYNTSKTSPYLYPGVPAKGEPSALTNSA